ncbi:hypothetical protein P389DRAFT_19569 [Cystobasidium minutum MCA 4210]|uniref:uncharacterized protein n=1 Tax=Cystobasidium minutum MCA 4210 TaxID=1397322 RepID=UPI0034CE8654|eukprot:jgi/Rhomi1/19569/CE19568_1165
MTQHALLLTREDEAGSTTSDTPFQDNNKDVLITLTLDPAQVSAVVSAVQSQDEEEASSTSKETGKSTDSATKDFISHTNIKLVNPKSTSTKHFPSTTRHSVTLTESIPTSTAVHHSSDSDSDLSRTTSPASISRHLSDADEDPQSDTKVFEPSSGGIKAVITSTDKSSSATSSDEYTKVFVPSSGGIKAVITSRTSIFAGQSEGNTFAVSPSSSQLTEGEGSPSSTQATSSIAQSHSNTSSQVSSANPISSSSAAAATSSGPIIVTVTTTASLSTRTSDRSTSTTTTRIFASSIVAKPVITNANGNVVTVIETTGTAFVTAIGSNIPGPSPTATASSEKKNFFQTIDSSPTAIALTTIISAIILGLLALAIWCCMKRRVRKSKRRDSLFDFAPDANDAKSAPSMYSEKTPIVSAAYPFAGEQASFGYDSRQPDLATASSPAILSHDLPTIPQSQQASSSAVRFAGVYPTLSPERRKSSVDLGLVYRLQPGQSPRPFDNLSIMAEAHGVNSSAVPTVHVVKASTSSPPLQPTQEQWGEALEDSPLAVPPRPARPASLSGSITKKIEEMYNPTPRSSFSILPPVPRPWVRQARKWASMSSMGGGTGPDRRPSVDRRLYQQQLPSRFSITTFATSVEASPDLGVFRPRRTAITEQHLGESMLRTDIFKTLDKPRLDSNPFGDHARVVPTSNLALDNPSPMSMSEPWASTSPLAIQTSSLPNEIDSDVCLPAESSSEGHATQETSVEEPSQENEVEEAEEGSTESLETASQASAIEEEEEEGIRALIKRRQSASSAAKAL